MTKTEPAVSITLFIHAEQLEYGEKRGDIRFTAWMHDMTAVPNCGVFIEKHTILWTPPKDFSFVSKMVGKLEAEKKAALDKFNETVADINNRLSKLLALENHAIEPEDRSHE